MLDLLKKLNKLETEELNLKRKLLELDNKRAFKEAEIQSMSKEEWKELGITNEAGRKSHILLENKELDDKIHKLEPEVLSKKYELRAAKREYEYCLFAIEHNLPLIKDVKTE